MYNCAHNGEMDNKCDITMMNRGREQTTGNYSWFTIELFTFIARSRKKLWCITRFLRKWHIHGIHMRLFWWYLFNWWKTVRIHESIVHVSVYCPTTFHGFMTLMIYSWSQMNIKSVARPESELIHISGNVGTKHTLDPFLRSLNRCNYLWFRRFSCEIPCKRKQFRECLVFLCSSRVQQKIVVWIKFARSYGCYIHTGFKPFGSTNYSPMICDGQML